MHAADDHDHRRRETWWQAADGSQGHLRSSETLHKCPQVILGPMLSSLAPTTTPNLPKVALLHHLGLDHRRFLVLRFPVGIFYTKRPGLQSS